MPQQAVSGGVFKSATKWGWFSFSSIFTWIWKHKFTFFFLVFTIPLIIASVQEAIQTQNPIYPFGELFLTIAAADTQVGQDAQILEDQGVEGLIGYEKPTEGYWAKTKWIWSLIWKVYYKIIAQIYLIFIPLIVLTKLIQGRNTSEKWKNQYIAIGIFTFYLIFFNMVFVVFNIMSGESTLAFVEGTTVLQGMWVIIKTFAPLNGLASLIKYLIFSFI